MRTILFSLVLLVSSNIWAQNLKSGGILKPEQAIMDIRHYKLELEVDPALQSIYGNVEIRLITSQPTEVLIFDLVNLLEVKNV